MNLKKTILLWSSFFITVTSVFGLIAVPSYVYWFGNNESSWIYGIAFALIFGLIHSFYKIKTLNYTKVELDLSFIGNFKDQKNKLEKELRRIGYRPQGEGDLFLAGFRADYYLAPEITAEYKENRVILKGPAFYLKKIKKRINKAAKKSKKRINR